MAARQPSYADLVDRIAALESKAIGLRDLPLKALQNSLELNWRPSASVLLGPALLGTDGEPSEANRFVTDSDSRLALPYEVGAITFTWPGGSPLSNNQTINHDLNAIPSYADVIGDAVSAFEVLLISATNLQVTFQARDLTGSPAIGTTRSGTWIAFR